MSASFSSSLESYAKKKRKKPACTYRYREEMVMVLNNKNIVLIGWLERIVIKEKAGKKNYV
jgi:hypothetical protein